MFGRAVSAEQKISKICLVAGGKRTENEIWKELGLRRVAAVHVAKDRALLSCGVEPGMPTTRGVQRWPTQAGCGRSALGAQKAVTSAGRGEG